MNSDGAPALLRERFVVEIGIRQAWLYVTFADNRDRASLQDVRLYIDRSCTVMPGPAVLDSADEDDESPGCYVWPKYSTSPFTMSPSMTTGA